MSHESIGGTAERGRMTEFLLNLRMSGFFVSDIFRRFATEVSVHGQPLCFFIRVFSRIKYLVLNFCAGFIS